MRLADCNSFKWKCGAVKTGSKIAVVTEDIVFSAQKYADKEKDTYRLIGLYMSGANLQAVRISKNPMNYLDAQGNFIRGLSREAGLAVYMSTLSKSKLGD